MTKLPEPPAPDTHCWDDDARLDVWSHSAYQLNQYGAECYRKALEDAAVKCEERHANGNRKHTHADECVEAIRGMK